METLYTKKDLMKLFSVTEKTINRLMESGTLPYVKLGRSVRFVPDDIEQAIKRQTVLRDDPEK